MVSPPLQMSFLERPLWEEGKDGDRIAYAMFSRHYSAYRYKDNRRSNPNYRNRFLFCGPGEKLILMTPERDALFVWRKFIDDSGQVGVNCAVFRNESDRLSSLLICAADQRAWQKWPGERLYTYVDPTRIKSVNPGYCFKKAGWRTCGETKSGKIILEIQP